MTNPLPRDATWSDYVNARGGPEASAWWVTLRWYADSGNPRSAVVGPYPTHRRAVAAMQDSLLDPATRTTSETPALNLRVTARRGRFQAGALHIPGPDGNRSAAAEVTEPTDRSPGPPSR